MTYDESLFWLDELNVYGMRLGLSRIKRLCGLLGNPERRYKTIHVTGTNGKGSVSMMIASALTGAGCRTGLYTSPHLVSYTERMRVDGAEISEAEFADVMSRVRDAVEVMTGEGDESPTQFEALTAAAFLFYAERDVEYAVIEVGLGGLLDSTNVITPVISVITNVTMEHADKCGGTLEGVAHHKAGIIKERVPVVTAANGMPLEIIKKTASEKNSPLMILGRDFLAEWGKAHDDGRDVRLKIEKMKGQSFGYHLSLVGSYEAENSAVAAMALLMLQENDGRVSVAAIQGAMSRMAWPGRFELMEIGGQKIIVDGAHNPAGASALRESLDEYIPDEEERGRVFLIGALADKDIDGITGALIRQCDEIVATMPDSERAAEPMKVIESARKNLLDGVGGKAAADSLKAHGESDRDKALDLALLTAGDGQGRPLVVCGSLYLIGAIRKSIIGKNHVGCNAQ